MNHPRHALAEPLRQTSAADGMLRRAFTVAEVEAMVAAGIILEVADLGPDETLVPAFAPELSVRLADLGLLPIRGDADETAP